MSDILALGNDGADIKDLKYFIHQRMKVFLRDQSLRHDLIDACLSFDEGDDLALSVKKSFALMDFIKTSDGSNLIQALNVQTIFCFRLNRTMGLSILMERIEVRRRRAERNLLNALDNEEVKIVSS